MEEKSQLRMHCIAAGDTAVNLGKLCQNDKKGSNQLLLMQLCIDKTFMLSQDANHASKFQFFKLIK